MKMKLLLAIDSFKGCLSSSEANAAALEGVLQAKPDAEVVSVPVSDGGEGWIEAFQAAIGGETVWADVRDPLMRPIRACYLCKGEQGIIEIAKASGLTLLTDAERNPLVATSYGTGQLVADAVRHGCREIIVGLGGSATSDAGRGMLQALQDEFGEDLLTLRGITFKIATDVVNPLFGHEGAARVFAPQKGATLDMVIELDHRARTFAEQSAQLHGYDRSSVPGAGAAGGLGYAFMQYLGAECRSGIELLLDTIGFDDLLTDASLAITGEGSSDRQTLMGKLPMGILHRASANHVPVCLIAGRIADHRQLLHAGFSHVACINPPTLPLAVALRPYVAKENIRNTVATLLECNEFV